jgi:hypothetical protein
MPFYLLLLILKNIMEGMNKFIINSLVSICLLGVLFFHLSACKEKSDKYNSLYDLPQKTLSENPDFQYEGTKKMISILKDVVAKVTPLDMRYNFNKKKCEIIGSYFRKNNNKNAMDVYLYANELLLAGETEKTIELLEGLKSDIEKGKIERAGLDDDKLDRLRAMSFIRLGEQNNCISKHCTESCVFPIKGHGMHSEKTGMQKAKEILLGILKKYPDDLESIWLLNVAFMTLNEYPDQVPMQYRFPEQSLTSEYPLQRYPDIAGKLKLDVENLSGGCCIDDFDNDGFLDIITSSSNIEEGVHVFFNKGDGSYEDRTAKSGLQGLMGGLNMNHADYNNDGFVDVFLMRGGWWYNTNGRIPCSLLKNNGDGTFSDVTLEAGVLGYHPTQTSSWGDFNNDGWLDLFIGTETQEGSVEFPCRLYLNNKNGTFTDVAAKLGLNFIGFVKGVVWDDINNDGLQDLIISVMLGKNKLFINKGGKDMKDWSFEDVSAKAGIEAPLVSFPVATWDFDNDGLNDIFISDFGFKNKTSGTAEVASEYFGVPIQAELLRFYKNNGNGTFTDYSKQLNLKKVVLTMGFNYGDLDNDGFLDFYAATGGPDYASIIPNRMFRNNGGKNFQDVTYAGGFGNLQKGHAVSFGDLDNDGDQDIYVVLGGANEGDFYRNSLFENPGNTNKWITLKLQGKKSNRSAIGTRIKITTEKDGILSHIYNRVCTGASFGSNSLQQEIGLAQADDIKSIEVFWPASGITQKFEDVDMNAFYGIQEDQSELIPLKYKKIKF